MAARRSDQNAKDIQIVPMDRSLMIANSSNANTFKNLLKSGAQADARAGLRSTRCLVGLVALLLTALIGVTSALVVREAEFAESASASKKAHYCPWSVEDMNKKFMHELVGVDVPSYVSPDGKTLKQELNVSDGNKTLEFYYDATLIDDWWKIIALDFDKRVVDASCDGSGLLSINYADLDGYDPLEIAVNSLVSGAAEWGCTCEELGAGTNITLADAGGEQSVESTEPDNCTIQHRVVEVVEDTGTVVTVRLAAAQLTEFFEDLHVTYLSTETYDNNTDPPPEHYFSNYTYASPVDYPYPNASNTNPFHEFGSETFGRRLSFTRSLWSWITRVWSRLSRMLSSFRQQISRTLVNTIRAVPNVISAVATGNIGTGGQRNLNMPLWQWQCLGGGRGQTNQRQCEYNIPRRSRDASRFRGSQTRLATTLPIDLTGSFFRIQPGVRFELDINSWRLDRLVVAFRGHAEFAAIARLTSEITVSATTSWPLVTGNLGSVVVNVGPVPFHINAFLTVNAVLRVEGTIAGLTASELTMGMTAKSDVMLGIGQTRDARGASDWYRIADAEWERNTWGPTFQPATGSTGARVALSLEPGLSLSVNWIGGPTIGLAPYIAAEFETGGGNNECGLSMGWGFDAFVGAFVNVQSPFSGRSFLSRELGFTHVTAIPMQNLWGCDCNGVCAMA